jgi:hypothetical protein
MTRHVKECATKFLTHETMSMAKQSCTWNARRGIIGETMELLASCIMPGQMSI